jgi:hypothetical protein
LKPEGRGQPQVSTKTSELIFNDHNGSTAVETFPSAENTTDAEPAKAFPSTENITDAEPAKDFPPTENIIAVDPYPSTFEDLVAGTGSSQVQSTTNEVHTEAEADETPKPLAISPTDMDPQTQEKGKELQEVLRLFKQTTSSPISSFVLQTPKYKTSSKENKTNSDGGEVKRQRKSPRIQAQNSKDKSIIRLAQDLVAKKVVLYRKKRT